MKSYEWASVLLKELKNFPSSTDKTYLIDMAWLKLSLYDNDNIMISLKKVAPNYEKRTPKHQKPQEKHENFVHSLSINRDEKDAVLSLSHNPVNYELLKEKKQKIGNITEKDLEKLGCETKQTNYFYNNMNIEKNFVENDNKDYDGNESNNTNNKSKFYENHKSTKNHEIQPINLFINENSKDNNEELSYPNNKTDGNKTNTLVNSDECDVLNERIENFKINQENLINGPLIQIDENFLNVEMITPFLCKQNEKISDDVDKQNKNPNLNEINAKLLENDVNNKTDHERFKERMEKNRPSSSHNRNDKKTKEDLERPKSVNILEMEEKMKESIKIEKKQKSTELMKKQQLFQNILRESCVLEETPYLKKNEQDLVKLSFLANKPETEEVENPEGLFEDFSGLNVYRHNTFINSIKMLEKNDRDSVCEQDEETLNELIRAITHYKVLTQSIENHLKDPKMVLCNLKEKYVNYFINKYDQIIREKEEFVGRDELYEEVIDKAFEDLKQFIEIFHQTIYYFYKIQYLDQRIQIEKSFFKPENIHNFLTSILMDRQIYSILYLSLVQSKENQEDSLRLALQYCHNLQPKDFEVPAKYCLDHNTLEYFAKEKFFPDNQESVMLLKGLSLELEKTPSNKKKIPYESAIKTLQEIEFVRSPLHKLKVLVKTGDDIIQSIEEFYNEYELEYIRDSLCADDLLPIFTYVVAKSQVKCFYSQIKIMDELASRNLKNTLSGYYFVTLQIALNLIERCFKTEGEKEVEKLKGPFSARSSFAENMGQKLNEVKESNTPKKSFFNRIKDL